MNNFGKLELVKKELNNYILALHGYNDSIDSRKVSKHLSFILAKIE